ncbi:unnamed protein product [Aphanomyces euteiches]|uniref:Uncharacterized protein n=1 Tax=Aphanomyces euteiches TaxID=100861 RepID=A0A6G0X342_9STRA|nr:hypothetical protein Ae201684_009066 [Aphanomyces euteiches]KAH9073916.1 hypothetical protein Ae201684P_003415 [Aphanomyces euteiches]
MTTTVIPQISRGATVTITIMYSNLYTDMMFAQVMNASLISTDEAFLWNSPMMLHGWDNASQLIVDSVGPLYTIDMYLLPLPSALVQLAHVFSNRLLEMQWTNDNNAVSTLNSINPIEIRLPRIQPWSSLSKDLTFISGSLLCPSFDQTTDFFLREWGFDDTCDSQIPLLMALSRQSLLFAMLVSMADPDAASSLPSICDWVDDGAACHQSLQAARIFISQFGINQTLQDLVKTVANTTSTIEIIQLALNRTSGDTLFLRHAITNTTDPTFAFVGWNYLFDWVQGDREVVSFQGDVDTYDLISYKYLLNSNIQPVSNEISNSAANSLALALCTSRFSWRVWLGGSASCRGSIGSKLTAAIYFSSTASLALHGSADRF